MRMNVQVLAWVLVVATSCSVSSAFDIAVPDADFEASGWSTFGNAFQDEDNTSVQGLTGDPGIGAQSLKMFGNFAGSPNFTGAFQDIAVDNVNVSVGDLIQMTAWGVTAAGDSIVGTSNDAFIEITYVDSNGVEFGFGGARSANISSFGEDEWFQLFTPGTFVPSDNLGAATTAVRVKAVFVQNVDTEGGAAWIDNVTLAEISAVPEPTTASLVGFAIIGFAFSRRRRA